MLWVTFLFHVSFHGFDFIQVFDYTEQLHHNEFKQKWRIVFLYLNLALTGLTPLFGWIADARLGRYKALVASTYLTMSACVLLLVTLLILYYYPSMSTKITLGLAIISKVTIIIGNIMLIANNLPFITDQMVDASSGQLSATIDWWFWSSNISGLLVTLLSCYIANSKDVLLAIQIIGCCLSIGLCYATLSYHKDTLITDMPQTNPLKQIFQVLNYARKARNSRNRSALTYWEADIPSRMNLCMNKYGGPFTEEKVEDVKVSLRLMLLIFIFSFKQIMALLTELQEKHMISQTMSPLNQLYCLKMSNGFFDVTSVFGIPLFYIVLNPITQKFICLRRIAHSFSLLQIIGIGVFMQGIGTLGFAIIEVVGHEMNPNASCMLQPNDNPIVIPIDYNWLLIPLFLKTVGHLIGYLTLLKFIIAQCPYQMKGFLFGFNFGLTSLMYIVGYNAYKWFQPLNHTTPSCAFYYYITHMIIIAIVFISFVLASRYYRLRSRNSPVNVYNMISEIIEKYINLRISTK